MQVIRTRIWTSFVYLVLVAFLSQGTVAQFHIHGRASGELTTAVAEAGHKSKPAQSKDNSGACPICHFASVTGAYLTPSAAALAVPITYSSLTRPDKHTIVVERFAQSWRSRAPPSRA